MVHPMSGYTRLDPADDLVRVVAAIARRALVRRGMPDVAARLDDPAAIVRLELDDEDATVVWVDGVKATVIPRADLERVVAIARAGRGSVN
jgi:hypothetical protein